MGIGAKGAVMPCCVVGDALGDAPRVGDGWMVFLAGNLVLVSIRMTAGGGPSLILESDTTSSPPSESGGEGRW
jgi:hypothetical protein